MSIDDAVVAFAGIVVPASLLPSVASACRRGNAA